MKQKEEADVTFIEFLEDCPQVLELALIDITFTIYEEVRRLIYESDDDDILLDEIVRAVNFRLKEDDMPCLTSGRIVDLVLKHLKKRRIIVPVTMKELRPDIHRIVWKSIARYTEPSSSILNDFTDFLVRVVGKHDMTAIDLADSLSCDPRFSNLPRKAIEEIVVDLFYYLVDKGIYTMPH